MGHEVIGENPIWGGMLPFISSEAVSFGVVGLISSLLPFPTCAFSPVVLLSHPAFLCPLCLSYSLPHRAPSPHLTTTGWFRWRAFPHASGMYFSH